MYFCIFRRALNEVWRFMERKKRLPPVARMPLPKQVMRKLLRFILLCPLAQMSLKIPLGDHVTCSDASTGGGGFCVSEGLTGYGVAALNSDVRGDIPEAKRVVESYFPDAVFHDDVRTVDATLVRSLSLRYPSVGLVLIGAGPPCQGVSGLNASKKGALLDARSSLFQEVPCIRALFEEHFPCAQTHLLMDSVASMSDEDREVMSRTVGLQPYYIDSAGITLCHRPRLYWVSWELTSQEGAVVTAPGASSWDCFGAVELGPQWLPGVWVGKTSEDDLHLVIGSTGLLRGKAIRRTSEPWRSVYVFLASTSEGL